MQQGGKKASELLGDVVDREGKDHGTGAAPAIFLVSFLLRGSLRQAWVDDEIRLLGRVLQAKSILHLRS